MTSKHFIDIDSNRIKLLPHWRFEIRKPITNDQNTNETNPDIPKSANNENYSDIPK